MKKKQYQKKNCHLFYPAGRCRYVDLPSMRKPANHPPDLSLRHGLPLQPTDPSRVAVAVAVPVRVAALPPPSCFSWTTTCGRSSSTAGPCRRGSSAVGVQLPSCGFAHACMHAIVFSSTKECREVASIIVKRKKKSNGKTRERMHACRRHSQPSIRRPPGRIRWMNVVVDE
jgi:hypothetical protein